MSNVDIHMGTKADAEAMLLAAYEDALPFYQPFMGNRKDAKKYDNMRRHHDEMLLRAAQHLGWHMKYGDHK